jgi:hypothetical protein
MYIMNRYQSFHPWVQRRRLHSSSQGDCDCLTVTVTQRFSLKKILRVLRSLRRCGRSTRCSTHNQSR